jgi:hypothetical protein
MPVTLQELLAIEQDSLFAECVCPATGILVWPAIRNIVLRMVVSDWFYSARPLVDTDRKHRMIHVGKVAARAALHNIANPPGRSSMLIYATGAGLLKRNGFSRNRYTHYFSEALGGDSWSIELPFEYEWPPPREMGRLSFSLPALTAISLYSRIAVAAAVRRIAEKVVERAAQRAETLLGWRLDDARRKWLVDCCARLVAGYPLKRKWFKGWLERVKPRLVLVEEGCYGHMAVVNSTCRELGIAVAEYQHGIATAGHDAYNVSAVLERSDSYRRTMPDFFLGYGSWWNRQFNAPTEKVVIGNPHRAAILDRPMPAKRERRVILVLGEGVETPAYLDFCRELGGLVSTEYAVVFRPHPLERSRVFALPAGVAQGFRIDRDPDIYPSLAGADTVVAELSTGLFEAVGLTRRIFVWNTAKSRFGLPEHPFGSFDTVGSLAGMIDRDSGEGSVSGLAAEEIWAPDWQGRFRGFTERVFGAGHEG